MANEVSVQRANEIGEVLAVVETTYPTHEALCSTINGVLGELSFSPRRACGDEWLNPLFVASFGTISVHVGGREYRVLMAVARGAYGAYGTLVVRAALQGSHVLYYTAVKRKDLADAYDARNVDIVFGDEFCERVFGPNYKSQGVMIYETQLNFATRFANN